MSALLDRQGLTTILTPPLVAPVRVRFRDVATGRWIEGLSEPKIDPNHMRIDLQVKAYAPCRYARYDRLHRVLTTLRQQGGKLLGHTWPQDGAHCDVCGHERELIGIREGPANLLTNVYAKFSQASIFGATTTVTDTGSTGRSVTKTVDGGVNVVTGCAGTGATAATVADVAMQTETETSTSVTINAVTGSGSSGSFTMVYTVTAGSARSYQECGIRVTTTTSSWIFLLAHDSFSALSVSASGTLQVTYTLTNS